MCLGIKHCWLGYSNFWGERTSFENAYLTSPCRGSALQACFSLAKIVLVGSPIAIYTFYTLGVVNCSGAEDYNYV